MRIDAYTDAGRFFIRGECTDALSHHACLDGVADGCSEICQAKFRYRSAGSDFELAGDKVDAHDLFCNRVLNLDARITFDEVVSPGFRLNEILYCPGVGIISRLGKRKRTREKIVADAGIKVRCWRNFDDLLIALLYRTIPFTQMNDCSCFIGKNLHFYVTWVLDEFFDEDRAITKSAFGLALTAGKSVLKIISVIYGTHASTPTSGCGLQHNRQSDLVGGHQSISGCFQGVSGDDGNVEFSCEMTGADFVTKERQ